MPDDKLATLQAIDPAILESVVREDQRSPSFEITDWSVRRLSDKGIANPDGLWLYGGDGRDSRGTRQWSVVLKLMSRQAEEPPITDMWYWKRELLVARSGIIGRLPGPVKVPRSYRWEETPEGASIWMEHIQEDVTGPWTLDTFAFAARQLGRWNGACATTPLPVEPWFARQHYRTFLNWIDNDKAWQFPLNKNHVSARTHSRFDRLWAERESFYALIERLPQSFCHFDCTRRNLFVRKGAQHMDELVVIDWGLCGLGPLGAELTQFVGINSAFLEWQPDNVRELDDMAFGSYLEGLREAGWTGDAALVRLGYMAWLAAFMGCTLPGGVAAWCAPESREGTLAQFGIAEEELFWKWLPLYDFLVDCADEARQLGANLSI